MIVAESVWNDGSNDAKNEVPTTDSLTDVIQCYSSSSEDERISEDEYVPCCAFHLLGLTTF